MCKTSLTVDKIERRHGGSICTHIKIGEQQPRVSTSWAAVRTPGNHVNTGCWTVGALCGALKLEITHEIREIFTKVHTQYITVVVHLIWPYCTSWIETGYSVLYIFMKRSYLPWCCLSIVRPEVIIWGELGSVAKGQICGVLVAALIHISSTRLPLRQLGKACCSRVDSKRELVIEGAPSSLLTNFERLVP